MKNKKKRTVRRIIHLISIFKPSSIYKILVHLYVVTIKPNRTTELIRIVEENNYNSFIEVGVREGQNLIAIAKVFRTPFAMV